MVVKELIKKLENLSPDVLVVVEGYEGGFADVNEVKVVPLKIDVHKEWYYGPHELSELDETGSVKGLLIAGQKMGSE